MTLVMKNVTKSFVAQGVKKEILRGVSLDLQPGETLSLTGDSGSGKSTLLHLAAALDHADSGTILVDDQNLDRLSEGERSRLRRDTVTLVFQQFNLVPSLNVSQNIALHARMAGRFDARWCNTLSDFLGLTGFQDRYPDQLSGGQQQRVAIARAMAVRPKLLLADEPTGNLDETSSQNVLDLLFQLVSHEGTSLLLVTHSEAIAAQTQKRLYLSEGRVS